MKRFINSKKIFVFLVGIYLVYTLINQQVTMNNQKKELKKWNIEYEKAKDENQKLKDEVNLAKRDDYIEKIAREKLGLVKKGETTIVDKKK